jgi:arylsulfatase A-like enzyme/Tfp pilus assembly protein PilF
MIKGPRKQRYAFAAGLAVLVGVAGFLLWPSRRINLLLITLDTTRADRIGCYGYQPALTPALDEIAAGGVLFENAFAACPVTLPSHSTMFTGLTPREHGIHHNGMGKLDSRIPTLAEMLSSRGYETGGFVGAFVLNRKFGLNRGFRKYDDSTGAEVANGQVQRRRGAPLVVDVALEWLKTRTSRPFFCWVHLFDPHAPYRPREELFGPRFAEHPYDAGIALADQQIARIIDFLDQHNLRSRTLIVVVGDHGEGLGDHDEREHGHMLYNSTLRVPLIVAHPGLCKRGHLVADPVSLVDLLPTFEDCLALNPAPKRSGRSLRRGLAGEAFEPRSCYAETDIPFLEHHCAPQRSLVADNWKYIRSPRPEIYNLLQDPEELHNLADARPETVQKMEVMLADLEARLPVRTAPAVNLSAAERRSLAGLGYVASPKGGRRGGTGDAPAQQSLPDIKDRLRFHEAVEDANVALDENRPRDALAALEKVAAAVPDYLPARMFLGEALAKSEQLDEARQVFEKLAQEDPEQGAVHSRLGWVLGRLGQTEAALVELNKAVELAPDTAEYLVNLGSTFLELNHPDEARELFRNAMDVDPACANFEIGKILAAGGDLNGAVRCYKQTLEADPNWIPLNSEIAILLARQKQFDEAIVYALRAVQLSPYDADVHYNLGFMHAEQGKFAEAQGSLQEALRLNPRHSQAAAQLKRAQQALAKE